MRDNAGCVRPPVRTAFARTIFALSVTLPWSVFCRRRVCEAPCPAGALPFGVAVLPRRRSARRSADPDRLVGVLSGFGRVSASITGPLATRWRWCSCPVDAGYGLVPAGVGRRGWRVGALRRWLPLSDSVQPRCVDVRVVRSLGCVHVPVAAARASRRCSRRSIIASLRRGSTAASDRLSELELLPAPRRVDPTGRCDVGRLDRAVVAHERQAHAPARQSCSIRRPACGVRIKSARTGGHAPSGRLSHEVRRVEFDADVDADHVAVHGDEESVLFDGHVLLELRPQ